MKIAANLSLLFTELPLDEIAPAMGATGLVTEVLTESTTRTSSAPLTTWALVTIRPSSLTKKPEPTEAWLSCPFSSVRTWSSWPSI